MDQDAVGGIADLLDVCLVDIISGGDWPQFEKQVVSRLPERARLDNLFIQPTTGTKLYRWSGEWKPVYAELFSTDERRQIEAALDDAVKAYTAETGDQPLAELALDRTRFDLGRVLVDYWEIEIEELGGHGDEVPRTLGQALRERYPDRLEPSTMGKYSRGLRLENELRTTGQL